MNGGRGALGVACVRKLPRLQGIAVNQPAVRLLRELLASPPEALAQMRRRSQELVQSHASPGAYTTAFADFVRRIVASPRVSLEPPGQRLPRFTDRLPLGLLTRVLPGTLWH